MIKYLCPSQGPTCEHYGTGSAHLPALLLCACATHISSVDHILSGAFTGRLGGAILVKEVVNVDVSGKYERALMTGKHVIADISCGVCQERIGWKYLEAPKGQEYKVNHFILERQLVRKQNVGW